MSFRMVPSLLPGGGYCLPFASAADQRFASYVRRWRKIQRRLMNAVEQVGEYRLRNRQQRLGDLRVVVACGLHRAQILVRYATFRLDRGAHEFDQRRELWLLRRAAADADSLLFSQIFGTPPTVRL